MPYPGLDNLSVTVGVIKGSLSPTLPEEAKYALYKNIMSRCYQFDPKGTMSEPWINTMDIDRPLFGDICSLLEKDEEGYVQSVKVIENIDEQPLYQ